MSRSSRTWGGATGLLVVAVAAILIVAGGSTAKRSVVAQKTGSITPFAQFTNASTAPQVGWTVVVNPPTNCDGPIRGQLEARAVDPQTQGPGKTEFTVEFSIPDPPDPTSMDLDLGGLLRQHGGDGSPFIVNVPLTCPGASGSTSMTGIVSVDGQGNLTPRDAPGLPGNVVLSMGQFTRTGSTLSGVLTVKWAQPSNLGSCKSGSPSGYQLTIQRRQAAGDTWRGRPSISVAGTSYSARVPIIASQQYLALVSMKSPCGLGASGQSNVVTSPGNSF